MSQLLRFLCACIVTLAACQSPAASPDGGAVIVPSVDAAPTPPDVGGAPFAVSLNPVALRVVRGAAATNVQITVARVPSFQQTIQVELDGLPDGVTAAPVAVTPATTTATMSLGATASSTLGPLTVTLTATSGAYALRSPVTLLVADPSGTVDETWNGGNAVVAEPWGVVTYGLARLFVRPSGAVVFGVYAEVANQWKLAFYQVTAQGTFDTTFGTAGEVAEDNFRVHGTSLGADGKLVVVGDAEPQSYTTTFIRFDAAGNPDTSFGSSTTLPGSLVDSSGSHPTAVTVQSTGDIVYAQENAANVLTVCRLTAAGLEDTTFARGQRCWTATAPFATLTSLCTAAGTDEIFGGGVWSSETGLYAVHLTADAEQQHEVEVAPPSGASEINLGNIVSSGDVLMVGYDLPGTFPALATVARIGDAGADPTFVQPFMDLGTAGGYTEFTDAAIQSDGKIIVVGDAANGSVPHGIMLRFSDTGAPDPTFGKNGMISEPDVQYFRAVALQPDGRIVTTGIGSAGVVVSRYWP